MISVLLPTRGRPRSLFRSTDSLLSTAARPDLIEFLIATDPDDVESFQAATSLEQVRVWVAPERYGYARLHEYYNELARRARGDWLLLWNDDAFMTSFAWDRIIEDNSPAVLRTQANHCGSANLFPAWPRAFSDAMGHVSLSPHCDLWLGQVADMAGCHFGIPVQVQHDRKDVTGGHDDSVYAEGRGLLAADGTYPEHWSEDNQRARQADADCLRELLRGTSRSVSGC